MSKIQKFYDDNVHGEWERLGSRHRTEFAVTIRAMKEFLPLPPSKVIDIGCGPGRYALALAGLGYEVSLVDLSQGNLTFARKKAEAAGLHLDQILQANALDLSEFLDGSVDAVVMMGPLYHLLLHEERILALQEARRLLKPGGLIFTAFISRFGAFRDAASKGAAWVLEDQDTVENILRTGIDVSDGNGFPDAYFAHPNEVIPLCESAGFQTKMRMGCEGVAAGHESYINSLEGEKFERWVDLNYQIGQDPAAIGASDHILYIGRKP